VVIYLYYNRVFLLPTKPMKVPKIVLLLLSVGLLYSYVYFTSQSCLRQGHLIGYVTAPAPFKPVQTSAAALAGECAPVATRCSLLLTFMPSIFRTSIVTYAQRVLDEHASAVECLTLHGARIFLAEYRERCFQGYNTHVMQIVVNTTYDALSKIDSAQDAITNPVIGNASLVQCPALALWRIMLDGDVTDIYVADVLNPNAADKALLARIKPYLYNDWSINFSGWKAWQIAVLVIGLCITVFTAYICVYVCRNPDKWHRWRARLRNTGGGGSGIRSGGDSAA